MSINIFGSQYSSEPSSENSKLLSFAKSLQKKVDKNGDFMTGSLNMVSHKITSSFIPDMDETLTNKKYVDSKFVTLSENIQLKADNEYVDSLIMQTNDNVGQHVNTVIEKAIGNLDVDKKIKSESAVTKLYIDGLINKIENRINRVGTLITIISPKVDISIDKLFDIAVVINNLLVNKELNFDTFSESYRCFERMYDKTSTIISEVLKSSVFYTNLKAAVILVIEDLPSDVFIELKGLLIRENLVSTPEDKTLRKKYRRFINELSRVIDPTRSNEDLELLVQKNLLLLDLGFEHLLESLLKRLLDDS
jgi:hypothetical protein